MMGWHKTADKLPDDDQECLLMNQWGATHGPIKFTRGEVGSSAAEGFWLDLFATPEAGVFIQLHEVVLWVSWDDIRPTDEQLTMIKAISAV